MAPSRAALWMAASARRRAASMRGRPGRACQGCRSIRAGRMPVASSSASPPLEGADVGGLEDGPPLEGDLLAGVAAADADRADGHVVVADEKGDVAGEPGESTPAPMSFLVALPHRAAMPGSPQTVDALLVALQDGDRDHAAAAEVGVQVGQVGDAADVGGLVQYQAPWAGRGGRRTFGMSPPGAHGGVGEPGDQRGGRRTGSVIRYSTRGCPGTEAGSKRAARACRRGDPGHDLLSLQALGGGAGGLVDAVAGFRRAVLGAAQRGRPGRRYPASSSSWAGVGRAGIVQPRRYVAQGARGGGGSRRLVSSSWAAGPQMSRLVLSSTVRTKWPASRWAASTVVIPASGFHHHRCPAAVTRCGSNTHTRDTGGGAEFSGGGPQVGADAGGDDRPGADSTYGMPRLVVLPDRGPMNARQGVFPRGEQVRAVAAGLLRSRPSSRPMSEEPEGPPGRTPASEGRSRMAAAASSVFELARWTRIPAERGHRVAGPG